MQNFFSYPIVVDELGQNEQKYNLRAGAEDLRYLTEVFNVPSVESFSADIRLKLNNREHLLTVWGKVRSEMVLQSVVTLENFAKVYEPEFEIKFDTRMTYNQYRELEADIEDDIPDIIENGRIDLGQIAIEQVALVMEDYPRQEGEVFQFVSEFDEETTEKANPFSILAKLKK